MIWELDVFVVFVPPDQQVALNGNVTSSLHARSLLPVHVVRVWRVDTHIIWGLTDLHLWNLFFDSWVGSQINMGPVS